MSSERERTLVQITVSSFLPQDEQRSNAEVRHDPECARPPHGRIADKVDLAIILDPEVLPISNRRSICS